MARTFTKNLANHLSLGVNAIGPLLNGAGTILAVAQVRPSSYDTLLGDNSIAAVYIDAGQIALGLNIGNSARVTRGTAKTQSGETLQNRISSTTVTTGNWHLVGAWANFPGDDLRTFLDGTEDSTGALPAFTGAVLTLGTPSAADRIGRTNNEQTNQQLAGDVEYLAIWTGVNLTTAAAINTSLQGGTHPMDISPTPVFCMVLGYQTPDVDLVGGTLQSIITGSLPFVAGPTGLPEEPVEAPVITSALTANGTEGVAFSYTITADNDPTSFGATNLAAGLSVNTSTGVIDGTPTVDGVHNIGISATNAEGTDNETLVLTLAPAAPVGDRPPVYTLDIFSADIFSFPDGSRIFVD